MALNLNLPVQSQDLGNNDHSSGEVGGSGEHASVSGQFRAKDPVSNGNQGGGGGKGTSGQGELAVIPYDLFVQDELVGGYDKSGHGNYNDGTMRRSHWERYDLHSAVHQKPLKLAPDVDYAEPDERFDISHKQLMSHANLPIDPNHENHSMQRQIALNAAQIRV